MTTEAEHRILSVDKNGKLEREHMDFGLQSWSVRYKRIVTKVEENVRERTGTMKRQHL
jgi:hypothetical protein